MIPTSIEIEKSQIYKDKEKLWQFPKSEHQKQKKIVANLLGKEKQ